MMMMMTTVVIVGVLITVTVAAPQVFYESRYDHLDIESILNNRRMVNYYAACLLSKGPCPPQGTELKRALPEALQTACSRCTEKQKTAAYRTIKRLKKEYPKVWEELQALWDPDNVYVPAFETAFEDQNQVPSGPAPEGPFLANRFGEDDSTSPYPPPSSTTSRTTTVTTTAKTTTTTKPINKPTSSFVLTKPPQAPPYTTVGANLQATVSFGTNLVGGIVRSLGTLGTRVVETGTKLANMVISSVIRP